MNINALGIAFLLSAGAMPGPARAQADAPVAAAPEKPITAADLEGLRAELRSSKKQAVAASLKLTDAEATRFWPVYDQYAADIIKIKNDQYQLIAEYLNTFGKYDDAKATDFINRWLDLDVRTTALRARYAPIVGRVLPGVKTASFFQIDRRLQMLVDLNLASRLPVLQFQSEK
jgi:hypothetical protein